MFHFQDPWLLDWREVCEDDHRRPDETDAAWAARIGNALRNTDEGAVGNAWELEDEVPAVVLAARSGDVVSLAKALNRGVDSTKPYADCYFLLHEALRHGQGETAELLIMHGADVNLETASGPVWNQSWVQTPLIAAADGYCTLDTVRMLLRHKADINQSVPDGRGGSGPPITILCFCTKRARSFAQLLLDHKATAAATDQLSFFARIEGNASVAALLDAARHADTRNPMAPADAQSIVQPADAQSIVQPADAQSIVQPADAQSIVPLHNLGDDDDDLDDVRLRSGF